MKILCNYAPCAPAYIRGGWQRTFTYCGHDWRWWDLKRAFDAFRYEPDLYIGTTYELDRAVEKCIRNRPEMKVILFASAWGDYVDDCPFPIVKVQEEEKRRLEKLKAETGKPDYVFIHVTNKYLEPTMGGWRSIGIEPVGILNAYDAILYQGARRREELICDLGYIGGYWSYKAQNLDRCIIPLCHPNSGLDVKIFGNQPWPVHCYLGACSDEVNRDLFLSATVCPNNCEPHSTSLGFDIVERVFKGMGIGGFVISDYVDEARELFSEDELIMAKTPEEMRELIYHFVKNPVERLPYIQKGREAILRDHTYFDRAHKFLVHLGIDSNVLYHKERFLNEGL